MAHMEPVSKGAALELVKRESALEAARVGTWSWNVVSNTVDWDEQCRALFGVPGAQFSVTYQEFISHIHPGDVKDAEKKIRHFLATRGEYDCVHRVLWPDQTVHWLHCKGRLVPGEPPAQAVGISIDITWAKQGKNKGLQTEDQLRTANKKLDQPLRERTAELQRHVEQVAKQTALLDLANDAIFIRAGDRKISYWNEGAERLYGWSRMRPSAIPLTSS